MPNDNGDELRKPDAHGGAGSPTAGAYISGRSQLQKRIKALLRMPVILIGDDNGVAARRIDIVLRIVFAGRAAILNAASVDALLLLTASHAVDVIVLGDGMDRDCGCTKLVPQLRQSAKFHGPIVVVSSHLTRRRITELAELGVATVLHKYEVDTLRLATHILDNLDRSRQGLETIGD